MTSLKDKPALETTLPSQPQMVTQLQDLQRQLVDVHNNHQNALLQSHLAFLNTFSQLMGQQPRQVLNQPVMKTPVLASAVQTAAPAQPVFTQQPAPVSSPAYHPAPVSPVFVSPLSAQPVQPPAPVISSPPPQTQSVQNTQQLVMEIIVEKTGYPLEMLNPEMDIEADLGIDSIKRVEILSSLREKMPHLPEMDAAILSNLKTVRDIMNYIDTDSGEALQKKKSLNAVS